MLRNRLVRLLCASLTVLVMGLVAAAPPKTTGAKKKPAGSDATSTESTEAKSATKDDQGEIDEDDADSKKKVVKTDAEWKRILTPMQFKVARKKGTELAFGPAYNKFKKEGDGIYKCVCCGQILFESKTKFDSGTGWPSFYQPVDEKAINRLEDRTESEVRIEVECSRCDGHLGHVFDDGPRPTGERFCMNYASLKFVPKDAADKGAKPKDTKPKAKGSKAKGSE